MGKIRSQNLFSIVFYEQDGYNKDRNKSKKGGADHGKIEDMNLRKMLLELEEMLQRVYGNKLKAVILYGSVARGTATEESDIDIMVLIDGTAQELRAFEDQLSDVSTDISIKYFKVFSIIDISYQEYMQWMNTLPFYKNVSQEGVVLYAA
ncbi:MAG: nucleotidyltransferase domain-containing protein [Blautia sp.]